MAPITAPVQAASYPQAAGLWLVGEADDLEDGAIAHELSPGVANQNLQGSSNLSGVLGYGGILPMVLPQGNHIITLRATDVSGTQTTATVSVSIQ